MTQYKRQPVGHWRNSTRYKTMRKRFFASFGQVGVCSICREPVNMAISGKARMGPTIDHLIPVSKGGKPLDVGNWLLAHRGCNSSKGVAVNGTPSGVRTNARRPGCTCTGEYPWCLVCEPRSPNA